MDIIDQVNSIMNSDLCPDEKWYELGYLTGGIIANLIAGAGGYKAGGMAAGRGGSPLAPRTAPGSDGCFVAGTLVLMADGTHKPIEQVKNGDLVLSRDEKSKKTATKKVEQTSIRQVQSTLVLEFSNGSHIETTSEHPFYVEGKGFVPAKELGVGTSIVTRAGPVVVTKVELRSGLTTVYNFTVEGFHTYFVGQTSIWVHNVGCPLPTEPSPTTTVIGRMKDIEKFDGPEFDHWGKSGRIPKGDEPEVTWPENRNWLQERIDRGDQFGIATDPATLPPRVGGRIPGQPNGYYTTLELHHLRGLGIEPTPMY